jgi:hypothetical protein
METLLTVFIGLFARILVPVVLTSILVVLLGRLDARWKAEAQKQLANPRLSAAQKPCWEVRGCSEESKKNCRAYANSDVPCWQVYRNKNGDLREGCLGCTVFLDAPVPVRA